MLRHFVKFLSSPDEGHEKNFEPIDSYDSFFDESDDEFDVQEIPERNSEIIDVPKTAHAFCFYDVEYIKKEGSCIGENGDPQNFSSVTYFGVEYSLEEIKKLFPEHIHLISKMEKDGYNRAVKTKSEHWRILKDGDKVI